MITLKLSIDQALGLVSLEDIRSMEAEINGHYEKLISKTGKGNDFLGWIDLPSGTSLDMLKQLSEDAARIREQSDIVVVTGIGGSYLGTRAIADALGLSFSALINRESRNVPLLLYAGHHLDADYSHQLLKLLDDRHYSLVVISKSGTTTEPAIAFRLLRKHLESKYGRAGAARRTYAITDASKGALRQLASSEGYTTYTIPDDVGGRFSVLTPVGLLPIAAAGFDIFSLVEGAARMEKFLKQERDLFANPAALYAATRNALYRKGKTTEILAAYNPALFYLIEWWKQLYGESEGKELKGIFPAGVSFTTDLHSLGQYIQEGLRNIFETVIRVGSPRHDLDIPFDPDNLDGLNYLAGKTISHVNHMAAKGTMLAHLEGQVPNIGISIPELTETTLGELVYFFEMACAISGYVLGVNPFDQPGVEAYKKKMFELLGKPGA